MNDRIRQVAAMAAAGEVIPAPRPWIDPARPGKPRPLIERIGQWYGVAYRDDAQPRRSTVKEADLQRIYDIAKPILGRQAAVEVYRFNYGFDVSLVARWIVGGHELLHAIRRSGEDYGWTDELVERFAIKAAEALKQWHLDKVAELRAVGGDA